MSNRRRRMQEYDRSTDRAQPGLNTRYIFRPSKPFPQTLHQTGMEAAIVPMMPLDTSSESRRDEAVEWVSRARNGDTAAFEQLYRRHVGWVYAMCLRITADRPAAEECTQDAFLRAWDALVEFRGESSFGTWLTRIAINVALQRLKLERRHLRLVQPGDQELLDSLPAADAAPEVGMDMESLIATLPPAARAVFVLHAIEGYSHEEIAALTGTAVGTCKAHVHRARQLLQARIQT